MKLADLEPVEVDEGRGAPCYALGPSARNEQNTMHRVSDFTCLEHDRYVPDCEGCRAMATQTAEHLRVARGIEVEL